MDKRISVLVKIFIFLFTILIINLTYWQIFAADRLNKNQYNTRGINQELSIERGKIFTADGETVAKSEKEGRLYKRVYPYQKDYAHIVGYYNARLGRNAIEQSQNDYLLGKEGLHTLQDYIDSITGKNEPGNDIILTIDSVVQAAAYDAIEGKKAAAIVIDPKNGDIIAMASEPSYNPNDLNDKWSSLIVDKESPLLSRATSGLYPAGSSFKIVSASAVIDSGKATTTKIYEAPASYSIYGGKVTNYGNNSYGTLPFEKAFAKSVNTVFAQVGLELGQKELVNYAQDFGFDDAPPLEINTKASSIKDPDDMDDLELGWTAVGQASLLATPLEMGLVGCAIANDGTIYKPNLVKKIRDYKGITVKKTDKSVWKKPIDSKTAAAVGYMMRLVVNSGTGRAADIEGIRVAGKTGTAEIKGKEPHAWFVGFAPYDDPKYVVVVMVENGGLGGTVAAPIAKEILKTAFTVEKSK